MCGIAGIIGRSEDAVRRALEPMAEAQTHRGPDDSGIEIFRVGEMVVGLGHRRLSIIDLSACGHQPMRHEASGDLVVYNGETYNFKRLRERLERDGASFRGDSDTEVILESLVRRGPEALAELEGMFALAWYRAGQRSLVLARDPVGIKPLYVARTPEAFVFASEVRAILASGLVEPRLDPQGLAGLLAYGAVQGPRTFFRGIEEFPAGALAEIAIDRALEADATPRRYWRWPVRDESVSTEEARERLGVLLDESVRDHLVADVPVGVFLSSGLDSTLIAGLAARHKPDVRTFTVGFADNPDMSEGPMASRTAAALGLPHCDIQVTGSDAERACRAWLENQDQPSMDGLNVYVVAGAVKREGITVALSGQGGDELFGGYPSFAEVPRLMRVMRPVAWMPGSMRALAARLATTGKNEAYRQKVSDAFATDGGVRQLCLARRRVVSRSALRDMGLDARALGLDSSFMPQGADDGVRPDESDPVWSVSQLEARYYMGNMLLRDCDANGMAHSLEIRVPILDTRMLDYFLAVPGPGRLPDGRNNKHLLRTAFPDLLRPEILEQRKVGFILPIKRWMAGPMREMCETDLAHLKGLGVLRDEGVDRVWRTFVREPEHPIWSRAFTLCVLGAYTRRMGVLA